MSQLVELYEQILIPKKDGSVVDNSRIIKVSKSTADIFLKHNNLDKGGKFCLASDLPNKTHANGNPLYVPVGKTKPVEKVVEKPKEVVAEPVKVEEEAPQGVVEPIIEEVVKVEESVVIETEVIEPETPVKAEEAFEETPEVIKTAPPKKKAKKPRKKKAEKKD